MERAKASGASEEKSDSIIPGYQAGASLNLEVLDSPKSSMLRSTSNLSIKVEKVLSETMAPVMLVAFDTPAGQPTRAVLKLFDRRFGSSLRLDRKRKHIPCRVQYEEAFKALLLREKPLPFIRTREEREEQEDELELSSIIGAPAWLDEPDGQAKYEFELWHQSCEYHQSEVRAYNHLQALQGVVVPRMYASVRLPRVCGLDRLDYFFSPFGILLEYIDGPNLYEYPHDMVSPSGLTQLVQRAVDGVYQINEHGIILNDSSPRNVAVDKQLNRPYIIDLAQCTIKEEFFKEELKYLEEGKTLEDSWLDQAWLKHNPSAIGTVMKKRLDRDFGIKIEIAFPDLDKVLEYESPVTTDLRRVRSHSICSGPPTMINRDLDDGQHGIMGVGVLGAQLGLEVWKRVRLAISGGTTIVSRVFNWIRARWIWSPREDIHNSWTDLY